MVSLEALQELMALLLLAGDIAHLKTRNVLQNMVVHLVLNVKQRLFQKVLYVTFVLFRFQLVVVLTSQIFQVIQQGAHFLRLWLHLVEELNDRFHEVLSLRIDLSGPSIELVLIIKVLKQGFWPQLTFWIDWLIQRVLLLLGLW
jgi:hypothetical protein